MMTHVMLSQPVPSPLVSGARQKSNIYKQNVSMVDGDKNTIVLVVLSTFGQQSVTAVSIKATHL